MKKHIFGGGVTLAFIQMIVNFDMITDASFHKLQVDRILSSREISKPN